MTSSPTARSDHQSSLQLQNQSYTATEAMYLYPALESGVMQLVNIYTHTYTHTHRAVTLCMSMHMSSTDTSDCYDRFSFLDDNSKLPRMLIDGAPLHLSCGIQWSEAPSTSIPFNSQLSIESSLVDSVHRASPLFLWAQVAFQLTYTHNTRLWDSYSGIIFIAGALATI